MKICFWSGPSYEPWGPPSVDTGGIGGSETACVHMARLLASLGNDVSVFGDHGPFEGVHDGVVYVPYQKAIEDRSFLDSDVFISSRDKAAIRLEPKAAHKVLWAHDIHVGDDREGEILKYDQVFCLSNWARKTFLSYYPHLSPRLDEKVIITRNGIDTGRYQIVGPPKRAAKFFYSSSPDRGLNVLLNMWPKIRAIRSDAELNVYYGFDTWTKMVELRGPKSDKLRIAWFLEKMKSMSKDGVNYHGRVGQVALAQAQLESSLWLYPTSCLETSCITAMEAQAAGAVPVTTRLGALEETVKHGVLLEPPATGEEYQEAFLGTVKGLLGPSEPLRRKWLVEGRHWALGSCSWRDVAVEWQAMFEDAVFEAKRTRAKSS